MKKQIITGCVIAAALCAVILPRVMRRESFAEGIADPLVEVAVPVRRDISLTSGLVGTVEPEAVVYVYPKAAGEVTEVSVKAGAYVTAGQQLCVIDTKQIDSAKSSLDSAQLALTQANDELSRQSVLYGGGGISEQAYLQYQNSAKSAQITYNNAKTNYDNQISYSQITAPISGMIETCDIEVFDQVSQNNLVCVISGDGGKVVSFSVTERIKNNLAAEDAIVIEKNGASYEGRIYEISSMAAAETGLFHVKAKLAEGVDGNSLSTGSMVKLYVTSDQVKGVLTISVDSVYYDGGLAYAYTYDSEAGQLHKVEIEVGLYDSEWIEVKSGLDDRDAVLTTWSSELYEGTKVRVKENNQNAGSEPQQS